MPITDLEDIILNAAPTNTSLQSALESAVYTPITSVALHPIAVASPVSATEVTRAEAMLTMVTYGRACVAVALNGSHPDFMAVIDRHGKLSASLGISLAEESSAATVQRALDAHGVAERYTRDAIAIRNRVLTELQHYAASGYQYTKAVLETTAQRAQTIATAVSDKTFNDGMASRLESYAVPMDQILRTAQALHALESAPRYLEATPYTAGSIYAADTHDTAAAAEAINTVYTPLVQLTGSHLNEDLVFTHDAQWDMAYVHRTMEEHGYTAESMDALNQLVQLVSDQYAGRSASDLTAIVAKLADHPRPLYAARVANGILGYMKTVDRAISDMATMAQSAMRTVSACYR